MCGALKLLIEKRGGEEGRRGGGEEGRRGGDLREGGGGAWAGIGGLGREVCGGRRRQGKG